MIKITVSDSLKDHLKKKKATAIVVDRYRPNRTCTTNGVEPMIVIEPLTDDAYREKLRSSRYVSAEVDGVEIFFTPELRFFGNEISFDYAGRIFKDIKSSGIFFPSAFSSDGAGVKIQNIFYVK
ncbi:MAG: hypothetical protein IJM61_03210 [Firmicutes bacterium]|jgi:hypothetical protein|nr:hypothetical protein [Bacillota bacterium]